MIQIRRPAYCEEPVFSNALRFAVEKNELKENPLPKVQWSAPDVAEVVDRRVVANPEQVRALLRAVADQGRRNGPRMVAFHACMYFAGMRPSEVVALRRSSCHLPESGWGRLDLVGSEPRAGLRWTDDGMAREARQLKHRALRTVRPVPIPPELVKILKGHLDEYGTTDDGRLFRTASDGPVLDGQEIIANTSIEQALSMPTVEAAILDSDQAAGDGTEGHAEQARNDEINDHAEPSWNRRSGGLA